MSNFFPLIGIECLIKGACFGMPTPPQIIRQFIQSTDAGRHNGEDRHTAIHFHRLKFLSCRLIRYQYISWGKSGQCEQQRYIVCSLFAFARNLLYSSTKQSVLLTTYFVLRLHDLNSKPYGVNYIARYALCLREGIRSTFAQDVVGAVDIGTNLASIFGAVQAVSSPDPLSAKDMHRFVIGLVVRNRVKIKKAGLAGIALFPHFDPYAD